MPGWRSLLVVVVGNEEVDEEVAEAAAAVAALVSPTNPVRHPVGDGGSGDDAQWDGCGGIDKVDNDD